jgi:hypothetical protein
MRTRNPDTALLVAALVLLATLVGLLASCHDDRTGAVAQVSRAVASSGNAQRANSRGSGSGRANQA